MALFVWGKWVRTSFLPHKDGLFEGDREISLDPSNRFTLVQGLVSRPMYTFTY